MRKTVQLAALLVSLALGSAVVASPAGAATVPNTAVESAAAASAPFGNLDAVEFVPGGIGVAGWAARTGSPQKSLKVHIRVDGKLIGQVQANGSRPDVAKSYPGVQKATGFSAVFPVALTGGTHQVCAFAIRPADSPGVNPSIGCKNLVIDNSPMGAFFGSGLGDRDIRIVGAVSDPNTTAPIRVHVYLDGKGVKSVAADKATFKYEKSGKTTTVNGYGHGFEAPVKLPNDTRTHQVCVFAINASGTPGATVRSCLSVKA